MLFEIILAFLCFFIGISLIMFVPFILGAPFEPSKKKDIEKMILLSGVKPGEKVADLGSGNGKVIIEFARAGAEAHGYEINPWLVLWSKLKIKRENLNNKAFIHWKNFWKEDLKDFNVVAVFQVFYVMDKLEKKLKKELSSGSRIVSNKWKFPNLKEIKKDGKVLLYEI